MIAWVSDVDSPNAARRSPLFREGLRAVLDAEPEFVVVGEAPDAPAGLALVAEKRPMSSSPMSLSRR